MPLILIKINNHLFKWNYLNSLICGTTSFFVNSNIQNHYYFYLLQESVFGCPCIRRNLYFGYKIISNNYFFIFFISIDIFKKINIAYYEFEGAIVFLLNRKKVHSISSYPSTTSWLIFCGTLSTKERFLFLTNCKLKKLLLHIFSIKYKNILCKN